MALRQHAVAGVVDKKTINRIRGVFVVVEEQIVAMKSDFFKALARTLPGYVFSSVWRGTAKKYVFVS